MSRSSAPLAAFLAAALLAGLFAGAAPARAADPGCETRTLEKKADLTDVATRLTTGSKLLTDTGAVVLLAGEVAGGKLVKIVGTAEVALGGIMDLVAYYYPPGTTVTACASSQGGPAVIGLDPAVVAKLARFPGSDSPQIGVAGVLPKSDLAAELALLDKQPSLAALQPLHTPTPAVQWHLSAVALFAASVSGVVKDARTGGPLPQSTVRLSGPVISQETLTDADGSYRFVAVLPGDYAVSVENAGYRPQKSAVTVTADHAAYTDNFAVTSVYPCDFQVHNETGGTLAFWYDESDGPHLAAIIAPDKTVTVRGMTQALRVAAEVLSPRLRWPPFTIACGHGDEWHFGPAPAAR